MNNQTDSFKTAVIGAIKKAVSLLWNRSFRKKYFEIRRLSAFPRYTQTTTHLLEVPLTLTDAASFLSMYKEIFQYEIYDFISSNSSPCIIDCGSNIGLSILYFKKRFPDAVITGFEPDPVIYKILEHNIGLYNFNDVEIINKAIWIKNTSIKFISEGGASGRIMNQSAGSDHLIEVQTVVLKDVINKQIDFLKIDIEGAEYEVLKDCQEKLHLVENMFIEYHSGEKEVQRLGDILSILTGAGFRYHIKETYTVPKPFVQRPAMQGMDLQLNIFAYRS